MPKIELENFVYFGRLFELYGKLLSEDRQSIMSLYFDCNMTLAEIASEKQISRQAVLDAVHKSCNKLEEYEKALHIAENKSKHTLQLQQILQLCKSGDIKKIKEKVEQILKEE